LGAAYFLGFFQRAFLGPVTDPAVATAMDLRPREVLIAGVMALLVLAGGLFPNGVQGITASATNAWVARLAVDRTMPAALAGVETQGSSTPEFTLR
jgi:NADH-quinone oxidoreductase subunit M